jgi:hypothetical protein
MKLLADSVLHLFHMGLLRAASMLVPARQRAEWWREWHAELWHVRDACTPEGRLTWDGARESSAFCLGAFQDALCLKGHSRRRFVLRAGIQGSAGQCVLFLAAVLAVSYAIALWLPGVRAERSLQRHEIRRELVMIEDADGGEYSSPLITAKLYRAWKERRQHYFDDFAFYRVTQELVEHNAAWAGTHEPTPWRVARASVNLFALLGLPVEFADPVEKADDGLPRVILSEDVWKKEFGADPHVAGAIVQLGRRKARIAGVAPDGAWGLPGKASAWLLQPDSELAAGDEGYVVGHLTPAGTDDMWGRCIRITTFEADGSLDELLGVSIDDGKPGAWVIYLFATILGLLALPAITSVTLGESSLSPQRTSWMRKFCRWGFLSVKIALLFPIAYFVSLDVAYLHTTPDSFASVYIQLLCAFAICLFGLRWVLRDQRQRCPVCLRLVEHPAQVGQASRTFLAWNGTELMCMDGHTLLHVPGMPTSWFGSQRWIYLDASWEFLFAGPGGGMETGVVPGLSVN